MKKVIIKIINKNCPRCHSIRKLQLFRYECNKKECGFDPEVHTKSKFCLSCPANLGFMTDDLGCEYCNE